MPPSAVYSSLADSSRGGHLASYPGPAQLSVACSTEKGRTKFTTSGAHDVIPITSPPKNDLCTEELRDRAQLAKSLDEVSLLLRKARFGCLFFGE